MSRAADGFPGALDADALDLVGRVLAQAGGVDDVERNAVDLDRLAHAVARGAGNRRDDGQLGASQRVEQRRLAHVRLPGEHHRQSLAQQRTLARLFQHAREVAADAGQLAARVGGFEEIDLFLGEVERGLHQHAQVDDLVDQRVDGLREFAFHRARGGARRGLGAGLDEVGHRFGLGEVELVVQEGAPRELAGLGHAQADLAPGLQAARQQHLHDYRAAVALQLEHLFAGVRVRRGEVQREAVVDHAAARIEEGQVGGMARLERLAADRAHHGAHIGAGDAHDANAATARCGSDGGDRKLGEQSWALLSQNGRGAAHAGGQGGVGSTDDSAVGTPRHSAISRRATEASITAPNSPCLATSCLRSRLR